MKTSPKYSEENLIPMFIKAAKLRNEMLDSGFTDNGGAIHSAERILDILGQRIKYPGLSHINNYKKYESAEFSAMALKADERGEKVLIEHVSPIRAFTREAIKIVTECPKGKAGHDLKRFVKKNYRLVLLTQKETDELNKMNRSRMTEDRISHIEIVRRIARVAPISAA